MVEERTCQVVLQISQVSFDNRAGRASGLVESVDEIWWSKSWCLW